MILLGINKFYEFKSSQNPRKFMIQAETIKLNKNQIVSLLYYRIFIFSSLKTPNQIKIDLFNIFQSYSFLNYLINSLFLQKIHIFSVICQASLQIVLADGNKYNKFISSIVEVQMFNSQLIATKCSQLPTEGFKPILRMEYDILVDGKNYQKVDVALCDKQIYLTAKFNSMTYFYRIVFKFDLIFQFKTSKIRDFKKQKEFQSYSIKIQKSQKYIELTNPSKPEQITAWRAHLEKKLNQRGFHETFIALRQLGKGNFGTVYLVNKHSDKLFYAIKAFSKQAYSQLKDRQSLINEIQIMRLLDHQNLMKIYAVYESQNSIYVCVEYLQGQHLLDKIMSKQKFEANELKTIMKSILVGLEALHALNIMHRDLKPQNILFRDQKDLTCVIADFGLAQYADKKEFLFSRCGTPGYVAPEVVNLKNSKARYGVSCDMFSLGIIFHILLLKKSPFPGKSYDEVLQQNKACKLNFDAFEYQQLPHIWLNFLKDLLEKDPMKRITATQALNHQFFKKQPLVSKQKHRIKGQMISIEIPNLESRTKKTILQCDSPLMMSKNIARKNKGILRDDSCLKFKMKQNIISNHIVGDSKQKIKIDSPLISKQVNKMCQSRFKKLADHHS